MVENIFGILKALILYEFIIKKKFFLLFYYFLKTIRTSKGWLNKNVLNFNTVFSHSQRHAFITISFLVHVSVFIFMIIFIKIFLAFFKILN